MRTEKALLRMPKTILIPKNIADEKAMVCRFIKIGCGAYAGNEKRFAMLFIPPKIDQLDLLPQKDRPEKALRRAKNMLSKKAGWTRFR